MNEQLGIHFYLVDQRVKIFDSAGNILPDFKGKKLRILTPSLIKIFWGLISANAKGKILSHDEIIQILGIAPGIKPENLIYEQISRLRGKLEPADPIVTVQGTGYSFQRTAAKLVIFESLENMRIIKGVNADHLISFNTARSPRDNTQ